MTARITALGTADAFSAAGRGHTCWLLEDEAGAALIDAGATVMQGLHRAGFPPEKIDAVHFTHLHGDHFAGWPFLLLDALYRAPRRRPLHILGPPGTRDRLAAIWSICYPDTAQKALPFEVVIEEVTAGSAVDFAGRRVTALAARHQKAPHVALSLRLETPRSPPPGSPRSPPGSQQTSAPPTRTIAFTGDTGAHPGLVQLANGADLLVAECSELEPRDPDPAARKHLSWRELRTILPSFGVRRILLGHLGADVRSSKAAIEAEGRALGLALLVCDDGDAPDL